MLYISFLPATSEDANSLSDLAIRSKGHWGYPSELLETWREDLKITARYIEENHVEKIRYEEDLLGFFALRYEGKGWILDHLWLLPEAIGKGIGKMAFYQILRIAEKLGIHQFRIVSDPHAEPFYLKRGARRIGAVESIPQGRFLPELVYKL